MSNFASLSSHNQILCLCHFNCIISAKLDPITYIGNLTNLHLTSMNKQQEHSSFCYSLLLGQFQLKLFYCGKGRQNFASNATLYPCEHSRQNHRMFRKKLKPQSVHFHADQFLYVGVFCLQVYCLKIVIHVKLSCNMKF